jgi:TonB family protein
MRVAGAGVLLMVLLVGIWLGWRAITPANSTPTGSQLNHVKPEVSAAASEPARLPTGYKTKTTSNAAPGKQKAARRASAITLPAPDIASSSAPPAMTLLARPVEESSPISTVLAAPVAAPNLDPTHVSQMSGGKLIMKVDPIYPPSLAQRAQGEVVLKAKINRKGQVTKVSVVRGPAVLAQAAVAAVRRWRYEPFLLNGIPTEAENDIVFNFKPPGQ